MPDHATSRDVSRTYRKSRTCRQHRVALTGRMNASVRAARRRRTTVLAALLVVGAVAVVHGYPSLADSPDTASVRTSPPAAKPHGHRPSGTPHRAADQSDGVVPSGVTI